MKRLVVLLAAASSTWGASCPSGYGYYKALTVQPGKVAGTQSNFRALILNPASTSGKLATVANGGRVTSPSGYDIVLATTTGTLLPFEMLGYTASNGNLQMWVNVSSITNGTVINLCYGNAAITTYQGDNATTWNGYATVAHMDDNAASTAVVDTLGSWSGTATANTSTKTAAGKIGRALTFNGSSDSVNFGNLTPMSGASALTVSMWVYVAATVDWAGYWNRQNLTYNGPFWINLDASGTYPGANRTDQFIGARAGLNSDKDGYTTTHPLSSATWHLLTYVFDGSQTGNARLKAYIDANALALNYEGTQDATLWAGSEPMIVGGNGGYAGAFFNGLIDDVQIVGAARSPGWVTTTYNNQSAPGNDGSTGFWAVSAEGVPGAAFSFTASPTSVPTNNAANIVVSLTGNGTAWSADTFSISGVEGVLKTGSAVIVSGTKATFTITTGATTGTLAISDGMISTTITVGMSGGGSTIHAVVGVQ